MANVTGVTTETFEELTVFVKTLFKLFVFGMEATVVVICLVDVVVVI
jgi:hypothetical protein